MDDPIVQAQVLESEMKSAQDAADVAGKENLRLNKEHLIALNDYYDKILFYSAGAFSFSVAVINLVVSDKIHALSKVNFFLPNIVWLYISWASFLVACGCVLISKRFDGLYIGAFGMANFNKKMADKELAELKFMENPNSNSIFVGGKDHAIAVTQRNISQYQRAAKKNDDDANKFLSTKRRLRLSSELFAFAGTIILLFFSIFLTQSIVWPIPIPSSKNFDGFIGPVLPTEVVNSWYYPI